MILKKNLFIFFIGALTLVAFGALFFGLQTESSTGQSIWGFEFAERYRRDNHIFLEHNTEKGEINLSISGDIEEDVADKIILDKIALFNSSFEVQRTGYPGQYTRYIKCPDKFKPKYFEKHLETGLLKYFIGFSNANFVPGACSDDLVAYKLLSGFLYCASTKSLLEIDYFTELGQTHKIDSFIRKINCSI